MKHIWQDKKRWHYLRINTFLFLLNLFIFIGSCVLSDAKSSVDQPQEIVLRFKLEAQKSYIIGQPVPIIFILENSTPRDLYVLTWYTPLEGLKGKIFRVTRNGVEVPYEGRMVKRGNPSREDYIHIKPFKSVFSTVDLTLAYNMEIPGDYRVEFLKHIYDVTSDETMLPRTQDKQRGIEVSGNAVNFRMVKP